MTKPTLFVLLTLLLACPMANAQDADLCATQNSTPDINACAWQKLDVQEKTLNRAYQVLLKQLASYEPYEPKPGSRKHLVAAQGHWQKYRETDCRGKERIYIPGTIHTWVYLDCMRERTEQRIKELDPMFWQGG